MKGKLIVTCACAFLLVSSAFAQQDIKIPPGPDSQTFTVEIPVNIPDLSEGLFNRAPNAIGNWAGYRIHVQMVDTTELLPGAGRIFQATGAGVPLAASQWLTIFNTLADQSGVRLPVGTQFPIFLSGHVIGTTVGANSDTDIKLQFWAIRHVPQTTFFTSAGQLIVGERNQLLPSDYTGAGPATPVANWIHQTTTSTRVVFASNYLAKLIDTVTIGIEHQTGDIPEPVSFSIWGCGLLCGVVGLWYRRRRVRQG